MEQDYIPKEESKLMLLKPVLVVLLLIVIVAAVLFGGWSLFNGWLQKNIFETNDIVTQEQPDLPANVGLNDESIKKESLQGLLLLSAENSDSNTIQTHSLVPGSEALTLNNESEYFGAFSSSFVEFADANDPGDFFFKSFVEVETDELTGSTSINAILKFSAEDKSIDQVTADPRQQAGVISWSSAANKLAYTTLKEPYGGEDSSLVWNWDIAVTNEDNEVDFTIEDAVNPLWSPDGAQLLYLKPVGIYVYDIEAQEEIAGATMLLNDSEVFPQLGTMLELSPDGNHLILTGQGAGQIEVFKVTWEPFKLEFVGRIVDSNVNYSWPVISPDGKTYAVLTRDLVNGGVANPRVEIRPLLGRDIIYSYPLTGFNTQAIFLDDWIAKPLEL